MFTIGDFATFTQVSIPALRLWDRRRILIPARVDPTTGYRFYSAEQAALVQRIVALEAKLRVLDRSTEMINAYDVVRKVSPAIRLATVSRRLPPAEPDAHQLFVVFGELFAELAQRLASDRITPIGPAWCLYDRADDDGIVVHAGLPIADDVDVSTQDVIVVSRPESDVASAIHLGDVAEMARAYAALMEWLEARSLRPQGGAAEISLVWDPEHSDRNVTELQITIASEG